MIDIKDQIAQVLAKQEVGLTQEQIYAALEVPPDTKMGDYAFPCFQLAKTMRQAPQKIAEALKEAFHSDFVETVVTQGPYLNFFVDTTALNAAVLEEIQRKGEGYGSEALGSGKKVVVEYSSTNIAKPFHIGHIRSTVQGDAIKRLYRFFDYDTVAINYIGDYGTQFGIMIAAYRKWGNEAKIHEDPINELLNLYVRYNKAAKEDESLMDEARYWFNQLEKENPEAVKLWSWFKELSLQEFKRVYDLLNVSFDNYNGESYNSAFIPNVLEELEQKGLLEASEGAMIVNLDAFDLPPALVVKSDGSSTYMTRDIATAIERKRAYDFEQNIYVVATQQNLHFKQLKAVLKLMGYEWYEDCVHVSFGMVSLSDGSMSTREGKVVFLEDVLNKAIAKTTEIMDSRRMALEDKEKIAVQVGIGAVKYQELYNNRIKDYTFDWDEVLNFDGETGPYVQYTYARANSILNKATSLDFASVDYSLLKSDDEKALVKALYTYPDVLRNALDKLEPSMITRHITEVAKAFNKFYNTSPIFNSEDDLRRARLLLCDCARTVIRSGLYLLGIDAPDQM